MELQIHHIGNQNSSALFEVIRSIDMKRTAAVALPDPAKFPVEGHPARQFLPELRWYLEDYLQCPHGVFPQLAECVAKTMQAWGALIFDTLLPDMHGTGTRTQGGRILKAFALRLQAIRPKSCPGQRLLPAITFWKTPVSAHM